MSNVVDNHQLASHCALQYLRNVLCDVITKCLLTRMNVVIFHSYLCNTSYRRINTAFLIQANVHDSKFTIL